MNSHPFRAAFCTALFSWLMICTTTAGSQIGLTIKAGKHDRANTPVRTLVDVPAELAEVRVVRLTDAGGNAITAQLTDPGLLNESAKASKGSVLRELHLILPSLKKGQSLELLGTIAPGASAGGGFVWNDTPGQYTELSFDGRPVLRYMYEALDESTPENRERTYKVYHHLYDPAGTRFVTKGPGGKYPHHRGLFFGFSRISYGEVMKVNTWGCGSGNHQAHGGFLAEEAGPVLGRHAVVVTWHGPNRQAFAKEHRELCVYNVPGGQLVQFASRLTSTVGKVRLDGDPQHAGFHFRAAQEVADGDQQLTYYLRPDGKGAPGDTRNWSSGNPDPQTVNLPWNAMSFVIGGKRYTAVYLDHPANPKEARYSERTYGRFGSYFVYELDEARSLEINYRIWLQEGEMTVGQAAARSADFVEPPEVVVK